MLGKPGAYGDGWGIKPFRCTLGFSSCSADVLCRVTYKPETKNRKGDPKGAAPAGRAQGGDGVQAALDADIKARTPRNSLAAERHICLPR